MVAPVLLETVMRRFFRYGDITLIDARGNRHPICKFDGPCVVLRVSDAVTATRLALATSLQWGEAYMDGRLLIEQGSLADFLEIHSKSMHAQKHGWLDECLRLMYGMIAATRHYNPVGRARKNVAHHYDLSAELYDSFLDSDRQYSCAYFVNGDEDIETAQLLKKRHIAAKLDIRPGMRILDIGSGWGGMGLYLARHLDCEVHGVTLSEEQHKISTQRVREAGLEDRVLFELRDYRDLHDRYDRVVSVGMLEHVGQFQYREYFNSLRDLLKPDGVALVHSIARNNRPRPINSWMNRYIFPGAYLPSASQLTRAIEKSGLWLTDLENLRIHYAQTLQLWYRRFRQNRETIARLYDERFCRMWEMYLLGCEMTFRYQDISVFQLQISRDINTLPITRDYIGEAERRLAARDSASITRIRRDQETPEKVARAKPRVARKFSA